MENAIIKAVEFVFTQGAGYITLAICFALFYIDFKKWQTTMFTRLNDKLDEVRDTVRDCHDYRDKINA